MQRVAGELAALADASRGVDFFQRQPGIGCHPRASLDVGVIKLRSRHFQFGAAIKSNILIQYQLVMVYLSILHEI